MSSITLSIVGSRGVTVDIGPSALTRRPISPSSSQPNAPSPDAWHAAVERYSSARGCSAARVWPVRYQRGTVQAWP
jgi:hypothetical protein